MFNNSLNKTQNEDKSAVKSKEFKCSKCSVAFNVQKNLEIHQSVHESNNTCLICLKKYSRHSSLIGHLRNHYVDEFFTCSYCPELFRSEEAQINHVEVTHHHMLQKKPIQKVGKAVKKAAARLHKCPNSNCEKIFKKRSLLERHLLIHEKSKSFKCDFCNPVKFFSQKSSLKQHQLIHAGIKNWVCRKCGIPFYQKGNLLKHMKLVHPNIITKDELKFKCNTCTCYFRTIRTLNRHITMFHGDSRNVNPLEVLNQISQISHPQIQNPANPEKPQIQEQIIIPAPTNNRIFKEVHYQSKDQCVTLKVEQKMVEGIRFLLCPGCEKQFKKPIDLIRHYRSIHKKERITCSICSKSYSLESTLKNHILVCHKSSNVKTHCQVCQKKFNSLKKLQAHMEIHEESQIEENSQEFEKDCDSFSETNPFQCLSCPAAFKQYSQLKQHETMHMIQAISPSESKAKCDTCKKLFSSISALNLHKKLHENKIYKCNICEVTMTTERSLKRHFLQHTAQNKKYKCNFCPLVFSNSTKCILHINSHKNPTANQTDDINLGKYFEQFSADSRYQTSDLSGNLVLNLSENLPDNAVLLVLNPIIDKSEPKSTIGKVAEISDISTNYDRMIIENPEMFQIQPTLVDNIQGPENLKSVNVEPEKLNNPVDESGMRFIRLNELSFDHKHSNISIEHQDRDSHFMDFQQPLEQMSELLKSSENVEFLPDATTVVSERERGEENGEQELTRTDSEAEDIQDESRNILTGCKDSKLEDVIKESEKKDEGTIISKNLEPLTTSGKSLKSPEKSLKSPEKSLKSPEKSLKSPEKTLKSPEKTLKSPEKSPKPKAKLKKYSCTWSDGEKCEKSFAKPSDLSRHLLTHTKEKPVKCTHPNCDKYFTLHGTMKRHLMTHADPSEKKTFACYICNKFLASQTNLNLHLQLHSESSVSGKRFSCPFDSLKFRTSGNLKAHLKAHEKLAQEQNKDPKEVKTRYYKRGLAALATATHSKNLTEEMMNVIEQLEKKPKKDFRCLECNLFYDSKFSLNRHNLKVHSTKS